MKTVISALHFDWNDIPDCVQRATAEYGLDGVELSWRSSYQRPHCTEEDFRALASRVDHRSVDLSAHIWDNLPQLGQEVAVEALLSWLSQCSRTGVDSLVVHGGDWPDQEDGVTRVVDILAEAAPHFAQSGVTLCVENHYAYDYENCHELFSEPWEFERLFNVVDAGIGVCFDTGHGHMTRNWQDLLATFGERLTYVHLADNFGNVDDHKPFRRGSVPWDEMFKVLRDIGFDGTFCVEFPVREDVTPFRECISQIRQMFGDEKCS